MFKNTLDNKRYYTLNYYYRKKFGCKIAKIPLDAGLTCPNRINGGCIYCSNGSAANIIDNKKDIKKQFLEETIILRKKWPNCKFIAYFQSGTNTYTSLENLENMVNSVKDLANCVGVSIATRPDCITEKCLKYLKELNKKTFLTIELGLQSSNNYTLNFINRGHNKEIFASTVKQLQKENIFVVAHIINGLPNETVDDMLNTVKFLNDLNINGIKIHMLHIIKGTKLANIFEKEKFHVLTKDEYIDIICKQIQYLNENIVIERITGDPIKEDLIEPLWLLKKITILNTIDKEMVKRNIYQGSML